jgi:hypothetical protein
LFNRLPGGGIGETLETLDACIYPVTTCILVALLNFDLEKDRVDPWRSICCAI